MSALPIDDNTASSSNLDLISGIIVEYDMAFDPDTDVQNLETPQSSRHNISALLLKLAKSLFEEESTSSSSKLDFIFLNTYSA